jgi:hypothetical protein
MVQSLRDRGYILVWEFLVIVVGVLTVLAVDEFRGKLELREQEQHLLKNLMFDLASRSRRPQFLY